MLTFEMVFKTLKNLFSIKIDLVNQLTFQQVNKYYSGHINNRLFSTLSQ